MKQVLQSIRSGQVQVADVPTPVVPDNGVLVRTIASLVSAHQPVNSAACVSPGQVPVTV